MPRTWILLLFAIKCEVLATTALRAGVDHPLWNLAAAAGYVAAFVLLGLTLKAGMPVGSAYAIWGALGVVLTTFVGIFLFAETLHPLNWVGIAAIAVGVLLVEGVQKHHTAEASATVPSAHPPAPSPGLSPEEPAS